MKILTREASARHKFLVVFILGILCPSLVVGYLSWNAFARRREALRRIVESQLWISGEKAVESIEAALQQYEDGILSADRFLPPAGAPGEPREPASIPPTSGEKIFLLDSDFRVVFPRAGGDDPPYARWEPALSGSPFVSLFERAEYLEFTRQDYSRAEELYRGCRPLTRIKRLQAYALDGRGRCLHLLKRYDETFFVWEEIFAKFGAFKSRLGHPYGVMAALQMYDIARRQGRQDDTLRPLISALGLLKKGTWRLSGSVYDFYSAEIEETLRVEFSSGKHPELRDSYETVRDEPSAFLRELEFARVLKENIVPIIKERTVFSEYVGEAPKGRVPIASGEGSRLVSYSRLRDAESGRFFYAGFCWDLADLRERRLPEILAAVARTSGIQVRVVDWGGAGPASDPARVVPRDALTVATGRFPFPWRYVVTQSAIENLRRAALRENVLNGLLLAVIIGLMSLGAFLLARDVSHEEELAIQKSKFIDNISHELKTPLTLIRLYGETLKDQRHLPEESRREAYDIITGESERLSHLINNVLDFSRIGRGSREFHFQPGSISEVVKNTLESYRHHLERKGFVIREDIEAGLPPVNFDREAMASVVINLLSNAMKFSRETKEVSVGVFRNGDQAVLRVEDKGIGIPRQDIGRIFERYFRSRAGSPTVGSGLGLPIVKHIADAHGGRIEVESEPEKGSTFSVFLPLAPCREENP